MKKINSLIALIIAPLMFASIANAAVENVTCQLTGKSINGSNIFNTAVTQRVQGYKTDTNGFSSLDSGFQTLASGVILGSNLDTPSLKIGQNSYYFQAIVAPGLKLEARSSGGEAVIDINISQTSPSTDNYKRTLSPRAAYSFRIRVNELVLYKTAARFSYAALATGPQSAKLAFVERRVDGSLVATPVELTCRR
jgi:hypothetical protein